MQIVVIGGGFAGINLVKALGKNKDMQVTLVDKNNYNFFPPLIYQVATAFLEPSSIAYPFRKLFTGKKNIRFRLGELIKVVPAEKKNNSAQWRSFLRLPGICNRCGNKL